MIVVLFCWHEYMCYVLLYHALILLRDFSVELYGVRLREEAEARNTAVFFGVK